MKELNLYDIKKFPLALNYLLNRGINDDDIISYNIKVMIYNNKLYISFPIYDFDNNLVGLVNRLIDNGSELNRYYLLGRNRYIIYNVKNVIKAFERKYIAITEGVFDSISLDKLNIVNIALLGINISKFKIGILEWLKKQNITLIDAIDNDERGREFVKKLNELDKNKKFFDYSIWDIIGNNYKDINQYYIELK